MAARTLGRRDRRQLADQGFEAPDASATSTPRSSETSAHIAAMIQRRLGGRDRARQRAAGGVHPAALGARRPRAARGAARRVRRRLAGGHRLRAPAEPGQRLPRLGLDAPRRHGRHPGRGRRGRPGVRATRPSRSARSWTRPRRPSGATMTAGTSSRMPAVAGGASSPRPARCASSRRTRSVP